MRGNWKGVLALGLGGSLSTEWIGLDWLINYNSDR